MNYGFDGFDLPPPTDWQKFERLCRDLWAELWGDPSAQMHGRTGQAQAGVDVFGHRGSEPGYSGVQCKRRGDSPDRAEISELELRAEVAKARTFSPPLTGEFVLAFTGRRDAKIQEVARTITAEHQKLGLFDVVVWSWDDIQEHLGSHVQVFAKHFSSLAASVQTLNDRVSRDGMLAHGDVLHAPLVPRGTAFVVGGDGLALIDAEYRAEVDLVRRALNEGHPQVALAQAQALRTRIWATAGAEARARLLVVIGHAQLELG